MKILIIRFSSIGDIVLTTPVVRCLKKQSKDAEVHYVIKKVYEPTLESNPFIDKFHFYQDDMGKIISDLKKERFDVVIDLQKNFRSFRIRQALGVKNYTFNKLNFQKWLLVNFKINLLPYKHIVDRYMEVVKSLGVINDDAGLDYFISNKDEEVINDLPSSHKNGYVAWVIGARHNTKMLQLEKMISIGQKINSPVVILGGIEDFEKGDQLAKQDEIKFFNACGKYSLNQSAAFIKNSKKVITHDTGLMHIAAAFKKDIISIWGNTVPEFGMYPYFGDLSKRQTSNIEQVFSTILEVKNLSCRPCTKIGFEKCPKGHFKCMSEIDEDIFNKM